MNSLSFKTSIGEIKYLVGFDIINIIQFDKTSLSFCLKKNEEKSNLFINIHPVYASIFVTSKIPHHSLSTNFVDFLRKRLLNFKIYKVIQQGAERIVTLTLREKRGEIEQIYHLIVEIMGKRSNIIVTDKNEKILESAKHIVKNIRKITPSIRYTPPPSKELDLFTSSFSQLEKAYQEKKLKQILGWDTFLNNCVKDKEEFIKFVEYIRCAFDKQNLKFKLYTDGKKYFIYPIDLAYTFVKDSSDILWEYYVEKPLQELVKQGKENLNKLIKKKLNKIHKLKKNVEKGIKECEQKELYKRWAENLLSIHKPQRKNLKNIQTMDIYSHSSINVPLKENKTLIENAQYYFKKYKRLNKGEDNLKKRKENIERELKFLQQVSFDIENVYSLKELNYLKNLFKPEKKQKKAHIDEVVKQLKIDEFTTLMGKNAIGNDMVTMSMANPTDFWFHVKDYPGAHIIIRNEKRLKELPQEVIMKAAKMVAKNSANRNTYVDVDYTQKRHVRKPKGAKKGMVVYTHFYTIRVNNVNS